MLLPQSETKGKRALWSSTLTVSWVLRVLYFADSVQSVNEKLEQHHCIASHRIEELKKQANNSFFLLCYSECAVRIPCFSHHTNFFFLIFTEILFFTKVKLFFIFGFYSLAHYKTSKWYYQIILTVIWNLFSSHKINLI